MAGSSMDKDDADIVDINITPLVDVVLVLLVIFMATATYIANQAIPVQLPKAATGEDAGSKNLAFVIDKESNLYFNGSPILLEKVSEQINLEKEKSPQGLQALVTADKDTPHGTVVKLIDVIRKNGITEFAINVEVEQQQ